MNRRGRKESGIRPKSNWRRGARADDTSLLPHTIAGRSAHLSKAYPLIAIVDDEEPVRRALRRLMRSAGLDVETFAGGTEVIQSLARRAPDCVVLDLPMPCMTGFDVQIGRTSCRGK